MVQRFYKDRYDSKPNIIGQSSFNEYSKDKNILQHSYLRNDKRYEDFNKSLDKKDCNKIIYAIIFILVVIIFIIFLINYLYKCDI